MNKLKKVLDILPPQEKEEPVNLVSYKAEPKKRKKRFFSFRKLIIFLLFIFIIAVVSYNFLFTKIKIEIWPQLDDLSFDEEITADIQVKEVDVSQKIIPARIFEIEKSFSQEFYSSGKSSKSQKATGKIHLYNNYSTSSQVLVINTRFISSDGKLFRSTEKTIIPGQNYQKGKLVAGEVVINVVADQPGQEYNIGPSTFSIPGFASTEKYTAFYGKSFENMTGGFSGEVLQITEKDLEDAKNSLTDTAFKENVSALKNKIISDYIFSEDKFLQEITETNYSAKLGDEVNSFTLQVKARSRAITFRKSDLESFVKESLLLKIPNGKKTWEESLKTNFKPKSINWENGKLILGIDSSVKIYSDIDQNSLIEALKGRPSKEAEMILGIQPQIVRSKINFWLFELKNLPKDTKRIQVVLRLD